MLSVDHLRVTFGTTVAVADVSLELERGQVLAVLGPSGCGKSTLLRSIAGLGAVQQGRVSFDGEDLTRVPTHQRGFALMFQDGQLFGHLTVAANIAYPLKLRKLPSAERAVRVAELLDLVGLSSYGDRLPGSLSGGESQRVALARALAVRPRLLLLDEPLSALDRGLRERLAGELHDILRAERTTTLLVTHDHEEAFAVADRLAVMRGGRIVQIGDLDEVWRNPVDADTARFLGYAAVLRGRAALELYGSHNDRASDDFAVALRRSALQVDPQGDLTGVVVTARVTPEQTRLTVEVDGLAERLGVMDAVAGLEVPIRAGAEVRLRLDRSRCAVLGTGSGAGNGR